VDTNEIVLSISSAAKSARNSLAIKITAINSDRKKGIRISLKTSPKQSIWQLAEQAHFLHSCHFLLNKKAESVLGRRRVNMPLFQAICHLFYILNFFLFLP